MSWLGNVVVSLVCSLFRLRVIVAVRKVVERRSVASSSLRLGRRKKSEGVLDSSL